jgi:hypothetical protein
VPAAGARRATEASRERPGAGGAARPFHDDDLILEVIAERIAAAAAAMPRICPWCVATLANGSAFCSDICREDYRRKLMPKPEGRLSMVSSAARVRRRREDIAKSARWQQEHRRAS